MPIIDISKLKERTGSGYPEPHNTAMNGRSSLRIGDAGGLTQFGANIIILQPGALSSMRHWHVEQDEFVMITQGTCTLVDDTGKTPMQVGDCATFKAGDANGHHFINETETVAQFLVIGTRTVTETAYYSDVDMMVKDVGNDFTFTHQDGSPFTGETK